MIERRFALKGSPVEDEDSMIEDERAVGLCTRCRFTRKIVSARGSVFHQCCVANSRNELPAYPPLPVRECPGFEARAVEPDPG